MGASPNSAARKKAPQLKNPTQHPQKRRLAERPHAITWDQVEREAATGKTYVSPYPDREGRPVVMMIPR